MSPSQKRAERIREQVVQASRRWKADADNRRAIDESLRRGGTELAESAARLAQFQRREVRRKIVAPRPMSAVVSAAVDLRERRIGDTLDFEDIAPDDTAYRAGLPVARVVELPSAGFEPTGIGSGFLVAPGLFFNQQPRAGRGAIGNRLRAELSLRANEAGAAKGRTVPPRPGEVFPHR
jgi:hypothetical protein